MSDNKKVLRFLVCCLVVFALSAPLSAAQLRSGVKLGLNIANLDFSEPYIYEPKSQAYFQGGVFFALHVSAPLAIQVEGLYTTKGSKFKDIGKIKLSYIDVPVLLKLCIPADSPFLPYFFAGGYASFNLKSKTILVTGSTYEGEDVKKTDFGLLFGAGVEYMFHQIRFLFEGRYTTGLSNILQETAYFKAKNKTFSIMLGISF